MANVLKMAIAFSRFNNYTRQVGRSGGSPGNWRSTAARWRDTYDRHHRTQNQPLCPPARKSQMQPLFRPSRLGRPQRRLVTTAPILRPIQMQPFCPPGPGAKTVAWRRRTRPARSMRAVSRGDSGQARPAAHGPADLAGSGRRARLHGRLRQREAVRAKARRTRRRSRSAGWSVVPARKRRSTSAAARR